MERRGFIATLIALSFTCFASGDAVAGATVSGTIKLEFPAAKNRAARKSRWRPTRSARENTPAGRH